MADDWFAQFNDPIGFDPAQQSANTGITGGMDLSGALGPPETRMGYGGAPGPGNVEYAHLYNPDGSLKQKSPFPTTAPTAGGQQWDQNYFTQTFGSPGTPQELLALEQQITAAGGKVLKNAAGVAGKIQTPDGRIIDVINAAGAGGRGFQWLDGGGGAGGNQLAALGYGFGSSMAPWTENFTPRDPSQIANDPAYQFQLSEGMKGIQNSAAARGTLLSGGTLKGIQQFGQGLASTYNDKYYDRDLGEYGIRRDNFFQNQDRPFNKNLSLAQLGKPT